MCRRPHFLSSQPSMNVGETKLVPRRYPTRCPPTGLGVNRASGGIQPICLAPEGTLAVFVPAIVELALILSAHSFGT